MRSLWRGAISFGLVTIPVKLYAATEEKDVRFRLLHRACRTPVRYRKWCPRCERDLEAEEIVRAYEYEPDRYVVIEEADLEGLPSPLARTVEIVSFVRLEAIDPIYFQRTYFLEPAEGGARAYALLRRALLTSGRTGLARVALRGRSSLAALRVYGGECLCLETMHYPDEVRSYKALQIPADEGYRQQELDMAGVLINTLASDFEPEALRDEYREALLELVRRKAAGEEGFRAEAPAPADRVVDLMAALRESVRMAEAARARGSAPGGDRGSERPGPAAPPH